MAGAGISNSIIIEIIHWLQSNGCNTITVTKKKKNNNIGTFLKYTYKWEILVGPRI